MRVVEIHSKTQTLKVLGRQYQLNRCNHCKINNCGTI